MKQLFFSIGLLLLAGLPLLAQAAPGVPATAARATSHTTLAWQRTDRYVPPDPAWFPDDPEGARRLGLLMRDTEKNHRADEEIIAIVRQGLRGYHQNLMVLRWFGNKYIWGPTNQNPEAIELMYHATRIDQHDAIYFGLSVVKVKTPAILRTLGEIGIKSDDADDLGRIAWGCSSQKQDLLKYVEPYLKSTDAVERQKAEDFSKMIRGELEAFKWGAERRKVKAQADYGARMPELREKLLKGDSATRREVLLDLQKGASALAGEDFLPAYEAAAADPDPKIRNNVAQIALGSLIWNAPAQKPRAIELALRLSRDPDREVRYNAVYYGLSTVREKNEAVLRRLIEIALDNHDPNVYGRITWGIGMGGIKPPARESIRAILNETLDQALAENGKNGRDTTRQQASAYYLHKDLLKETPPRPERFKAALECYPENAYAIACQPMEPLRAAGNGELWAVVKTNLPGGIEVTTATMKGGRGMLVKVGFKDADAVRSALAKDARLKTSEPQQLAPAMQLYIEERAATLGE